MRGALHERPPHIPPEYEFVYLEKAAKEGLDIYLAGWERGVIWVSRGGALGGGSDVTPKGLLEADNQVLWVLEAFKYLWAVGKLGLNFTTSQFKRPMHLHPEYRFFGHAKGADHYIGGWGTPIVSVSAEYPNGARKRPPVELREENERYKRKTGRSYGFEPWVFEIIDFLESEEKVVKAEKKGVWDVVEAVLGPGRAPRVLLAGPPGTGKTRAGAFCGVQKGMEVFMLTMTDETPMSEVRGHFIAKGGDFHFHYGVLVQAWRASHDRPVRVVINEIDHTGADCASFLHAFLDDPELQEAGHGYRLPNGEDIKPGPHGVQVIATMNGQWDDLPDALLDRFPVRLLINETHPNALASIKTAAVRNAAKAAGSKAGAQRISIRAFKEYERLKDTIGPDDAAVSVFGVRSQELLDALRIAS